MVSIKNLPDPLLYLILSLDDINRSHEEIAMAALNGGVGAVQLRSKNLSNERLVETGKIVQKLCKRYGALFVVNDRPDITKLLEADGVHLGQDDISPQRAREILGEHAIIGLSCHNLSQIDKVDANLVDYIGVGPIYETRTKTEAGAPIGLEILRKIQTKLPYLAIGGITPQNAREIVSAGCRRIAVAGSIIHSDDIEKETKTFYKIINGDQ